MVDPVVGLAVTSTLCVVVSMVCSMLEAAFYSVDMSTVRSQTAGGDRRWQRLLHLKEEPGRPIAAILVTNTIANTAGASIAGAYAGRVFGHVGLSVFSAMLVLVILWFGEILPKTIGVAFCNKLGPHIARPIRLLVFLWTPLITITEMGTRPIRARAAVDPSISEWELAALMHQGVREGTFRREEARLVESVLRLDTKRVRDIMTPRTVVVSLPADTIIAEAAKDRGLRQHSRVPIYDQDPDRVVGMVLRRDVLIHDDDHVRTLSDIALEPVLVPEVMTCPQLLEKLLHERRHMAVVVDEYGQPEGLVTLEDVLEALLGREIIDEVDHVADKRQEAERIGEARREQLGMPDFDD